MIRNHTDINNISCKKGLLIPLSSVKRCSY
jgi:hypothetical protein